MAKANLRIFGIFILSALIFSSCALKKMKKKADTISYEMVPEYLEVHGDSIKITVNGVVPSKYFNKRATLELVPSIEHKDGTTDLGSYMLKGEKIAGDGSNIKKREGGSFTYTDKVAYEPGMSTATLNLNIKGRKKSKSLDFETIELGKGTITTSLLAQATEEVVLGKDKYQKVVPVEAKGKFLFDINKAALNNSAKAGEDVKNFNSFIAAGNVVGGVQISGYASPDGEYALNEKLSNNRTKASNDFMLSFLKKAGIAKANDSTFFKTKAVAEDWDGLKQIAGASNYDEKQKLVNIVNTVSDIQQREVEMKKLAAYKKVITKDILPPLRRAEITINATEKRRPDAQIMELAKGNAKDLTPEELLYAATMTDNMDEKMEIYKTFKSIHADDWRGYNNMAYIMIKQGGDVNEIEALLDQANKLSKDNPVVYNNLGVNFRNKGDYANAENYYLLAQSFGLDESLNLGNIKVKQGDYNAAIGYYGSSLNCTFNNALANTLLNNFDAANKAIECAPDQASNYYLKAIIGARSGKADVMTTNLTRAIQANPMYRDMAKEDLEFEAYKSSDAFKVAIN